VQHKQQKTDKGKQSQHNSDPFQLDENILQINYKQLWKFTTKNHYHLYPCIYTLTWGIKQIHSTPRRLWKSLFLTLNKNLAYF